MFTITFIKNISNNEVVINYTCSRSAKHNTSDPLFLPHRKPEEASHEDGEGWIDLEDELSQFKDLPTPFDLIFNPRRVHEDRILNWFMRSLMVPHESLIRLAKQNVLLIGDAAHSTPILGGEGANMAIKDGLDMAEALSQPVSPHYVSFIDQRYPQSAANVEQSKQQLSKMHSNNLSSL